MAQWSRHAVNLGDASTVLVPVLCGPNAELPMAIVEAGDRLSGFEPSLNIDVDDRPVAQLAPIGDEDPFGMCEAAIATCLQGDRWPLLLPSCLSAIRGMTRALWKEYGPLSVAICSAEANLSLNRKSDGNGHEALAEGWLETIAPYDTSMVCVGLRSCSASTWEWLDRRSVPVFLGADWSLEAPLAALPQDRPVLLCIDCSVLEIGIIPAVPRPEPGGLSWLQLTTLCREIFAQHHVIGAAIGGLDEEQEQLDAADVRRSATAAARLTNWVLACHYAAKTHAIATPTTSS